MVKVIDVEKALTLKNTLFIDVRAPLEYEDGTILGAKNIPILDDEERAIVGTIYRQENPHEATVKGLDLVSTKLPNLYSTVKQYSMEYDHIVIFCWRGGMRSKSVCNLLTMLNIDNIYQLKDGYKSYRKYVIDFLENKIERYKFIMLHGLTGVGKTHILDQLEAIKEPVLNLEEIAKNSGSVFGDIVFSGKPPSQKTFESLIFHVLYNSKENYIFVESESKRVGSVMVPDAVYNQMVNGYHVLIKTTFENRIEVILKDYAKHLEVNHSKIVASLNHLRKKLGNESVNNLINKIEEKDYTYVIQYLMEHYYDPLYNYSIKKYENYDLVIDYEKMEDVIPILNDFINNMFHN
ncbi:tRNA 2-selenouridine(34) synthase MnmH [Crassaminicella profunda]|uniref:tRNA 2-selenouridine(34) synthase MnmH n=1 Tax=Crassaminicella profunda TaxID=1286698 RepID=UPI001CA78E6D|nr:tRNA 2-selenouridine(34) synthase MnmH [Crassaminicella profunda]QZY56807.1 tRNA 2-selenouridine(34) synthase MnmH [Crassaminicella profunda]